MSLLPGARVSGLAGTTRVTDGETGGADPDSAASAASSSATTAPAVCTRSSGRFSSSFATRFATGCGTPGLFTFTGSGVLFASAIITAIADLP